ncbi:PAS domain S-box protein [Leucothrix sargassi]|nr:PAS domain S-box protein [Leucothrix sargassi]
MSMKDSTLRLNSFQSEWNSDKKGNTTEMMTSIVAIGASAGGLEALQRWFDNVPNDTGAAFVVIQHLAPDYKSIMDKLLERHTSMPTNVVESSMLIEANQIYLIAPGKEMTLEGNQIVPVARNNSTRLHLPINNFFKSIANNLRYKSIGIILSGTGSDGCLGIKATHESGGLVMVQSPDDSQFNGMPVNAIATGVVDLVAPIEELTVTLVNFLKNPGVAGDALISSTDDSNNSMQEICWLLLEETGINFSVYKLSTFSRRLENRMNINQITSLTDYIALLKDKTGGELKRLQQDLFIGVTEFFRDADSYESLHKEVLQKLIHEKQENESLRIWSIGCSTGEEAYTVAMICHDIMEQTGKNLDIKIFATDADMRALNKAMKGIYPESISMEVQEPYLNNHFIKETPTVYRIRKHIRNMVVFAKHDILKDPPFSSTDLITCRNLLIYFQTAGQKKAFDAIRFSLTQNGYLFLGKAETPSHPDNVFECIDYRAKIYQKISGSNDKITLTQQHAAKMQEVRSKTLPNHNSNYDVQTKSGNKAILLSHIAELLFDRFLSATMIVDNQMEIVHSYGDLASWMLPHRPGRTQNKIVELFEPSTASYIMSALKECVETKKEVMFNHLNSQININQPEYAIRVIPFHNYGNSSSDSELLHIITLSEVQEANNQNHPHQDESGLELPTDEATTKRLDYLEDEVKSLRLRLKTSQAQLSSASEQLQTSNEELMASNEELQGTNEELQAVNEELYTLNSEYQQKINELMVATNDIDNFMKSTGIAAIFLDKAYRIRRYTAPFSDYINILPVDVNRSFLDLKLPFNFNNLEHHLEQCAITGEHYSQRVQLPDDRIALFKIVPYLNSYRQIDGVVLMIDEVKELTSAMRDIEIIRYESEQLYHLSDVISWSYDIEMNNLAFSHNCHGENLKLSQKQGLHSIYDLIPEALREQFIEQTEHTLETGEEFTFDHTIQLVDESVHHMHTKMFSHRDKHGKVAKLFGLMKDFSLHKELEEQTLYLEAKFNALFNSIPIPLTIVDQDGYYVYANPAISDLLGYSTNEITKLHYRNIIHPDDIPSGEAAFNEAKAGRLESITTNRRYITKEGKSIQTHVKSFTLPNHQSYRDGFGVSMVLPLNELLDTVWKEQAALNDMSKD